MIRSSSQSWCTFAKGAGALDYVNSESRSLYPQYRAPGSDKWERISWKDAIKRIARLMKDDRDANFVEKRFKWKNG